MVAQAPSKPIVRVQIPVESLFTEYDEAITVRYKESVGSWGLCRLSPEGFRINIGGKRTLQGGC